MSVCEANEFALLDAVIIRPFPDTPWHIPHCLRNNSSVNANRCIHVVNHSSINQTPAKLNIKINEEINAV